MTQTSTVVALPSNNLIDTNLVYVSSSNLPSTTCYISVSSFIFLCTKHESCAPGTMAMNQLQRNQCKVGIGDTISWKIIPSPIKNTKESKESKDDITYLLVTLDLIPKYYIRSRIDVEEMANRVRTLLQKQVLIQHQQFVICYQNTILSGRVENIIISELDGASSGIMSLDTVIEFKSDDSRILFSNARIFKTDMFHNFSFENLGIGGLDAPLAEIFRRAFVSRMYPPTVIAKLGIKHIKGLILYGPPGTGKTLIARQIGKTLNCREPIIVNGPELLNKYVGASEERIRELFKPAEEEYAEYGDDSQLHLIIFDEIDAITKRRGTSQNGTGVNDSCVNQLLTKLDGVTESNNVLVIGMTNRLDMLDDAITRSGRFEVHIQINLPDEQGRLQIFRIHTKQMHESGCLHPNVNLVHLSEHTANYSGAEIAGVVRSACSFALSRQVDLAKLSAKIDASANVVVESKDFDHALEEVKPAFGVANEKASIYCGKGLISYGPVFDCLYQEGLNCIQYLVNSTSTSLFSVLLDGPQGSGKTAIAATLAIQSKIPLVKFISAEDMIGLNENAKVNAIHSIFEDAYKSSFSVIVLDGLERLIEYVSIGPRFSNAILQAMLVLITKKPPPGHKLLVLATTSNYEELTPMDLTRVFDTTITVPNLMTEEQVQMIVKNREYREYRENGENGENVMQYLLPMHIELPISIRKLLTVIDSAQLNNTK